jgi:hypothetical protein
VQQVAAAAERLDHHPDLDIRYNKITATLSTHSAGGITKSDFDLAREVADKFLAHRAPVTVRLGEALLVGGVKRAEVVAHKPKGRRGLRAARFVDARGRAGGTADIAHGAPKHGSAEHTIATLGDRHQHVGQRHAAVTRPLNSTDVRSSTAS